jgi:hypothetical protein
MNPAQPPEGVLDPQQPWYPTANIKEALWSRLKAKLTGGEDISGTTHTSFVNLTNADADRLIENIKKYGKYPQFNQVGGASGYENLEIYQKWLVEEFLEKPFRQQVDEKIDAKTENVLKRVFPQAQEEVREAETKSEIADIIEDKVEVLEAIKESINPPRNEFQTLDPWEGSYTTGIPQDKVKKTKKTSKRKKQQNTVKKTKKTDKTKTNPESTEEKKSRVNRMFGGRILKTAKHFGKTLLGNNPPGSPGTTGGGRYGGGSTPSSTGESNLFGMGKWLKDKVTNAFQNAKVEKARALEAESLGYALPPEYKEKGYFLRKAIGYEFGGRAFDTTFGAFIESMPANQSSKKSGFADQFDYGDFDPKKKKTKKDIPSELASGFKNVQKSLVAINNNLNKNTSLLEKLISETTRSSNILEQILMAINGLTDVEIESVNSENAEQSTPDDIDISDIFIKKGKKRNKGIDWFDVVGGIDDALDITRMSRKKNKGLGNQNRSYRKMRKGGMPRLKSTPKMSAPKGRFGMIKNVMNMGRAVLSEGGMSASPVKALVGEAGPEMIIRSGINSGRIGVGNQTKMSSGGVVNNPGGNILATGIGFGGIQGGEVMGFAQPLTTAMELPFKVIGAQMLGTMGSFLRSAGPFGGVFAPMFEIFATPFSKIFGIQNSLIQSELFGGVQDKKTASRILGKIFSGIFNLFGISSDDSDDDDDDSMELGHTGEYKELLDMIASVESTEGDYNAYNEGGDDDGYRVRGWGGDSQKGPLGRKLTDMTISEIMQHQKDKDPPIHAAGRYQIIGKTMEGLINRKSYGETGVSVSDKFTPAVQDKLGIALIKHRLKTGANVQNFIDEWRGLHKLQSDPRLPAAINKANNAFISSGQSPSEAASGISKSLSGNSIANKVQGVFELSGPDTGYRVPEYLTGGESVIGHGLEWLMKFSNKFVILPGVNKKYDVINNPKRAFNRYEEIGRQAGMEIAGFVEFIDNTIFGKPNRGPSNVRYGAGAPKTYRGWAADKDGAEVLRLLGGTPVKGAMLSPTNNMPIASVSSLDINRNSASANDNRDYFPTNFNRNSSPTSVLIMNTIVAPQASSPMIIPVPIPGPVQYIPANSFVAARQMKMIADLQNIS